jgi:hypothetical protein
MTQLPLIGGGEHDLNIILSGLDLLKDDTVIAGIIKAFGWIIMTVVIILLLILGV